MLFALKKIIKNGKVNRNECMAKHTSFKIGGKAKYFVEPASVEELLDLLDYLKIKKKKHFILGNGTNIVFTSNRYNGVVVSLCRLNQIRKYDGYIQVFAGVSLNRLCYFFKELDLGGVEDAFGVPGSVGGAVVINAGAYNFEMKNVVLGVLAIVDGKVRYLTKEECGFGYRNSRLIGGVVISVDINYTDGCNEIRMTEVMNMRKQNQPLDLPSAGSVFKRCDGVIVSKLLDEMGYKGTSVGGAMVSEKHAGFIVNSGGATSSDVKSLILGIKDRVKREKDIELETEIEFVD